MTNIDTYTTKGEALNCLEQEQEATAYLDGLDLSDPYGAIVCSSKGNPSTLGGAYISQTRKLSPPSRPTKNRPSLHRTTKANARTYNGIYFLRVGTGDKRANCGKAFHVGACEDPNCHSTQPKLQLDHCDRYACPICYHHAIRDRAIEGSDRINSFPANFHEETGLNAGNKKHYGLTLDPKLWTRQRVISDAGRSMMRYIEDALKYAAKDGFYAFEVVIHLEREQHKDGTYCDREHCEIPASEHIWKWGPHVHAIGYAHLMDTAQLHGNPKFSSVQIFQFKEKDNQKRDAFGTLYYQLSHASVFYKTNGRQASRLVKHMGFISPTVYRQKVQTHLYEVQKCPCGHHLKTYPLRPDSQPDRTIDYGPVYTKKPVYGYTFNHNKVTTWVRNRDQLGRKWLSNKARADIQALQRAEASNDLNHSDNGA